MRAPGPAVLMAAALLVAHPPPATAQCPDCDGDGVAYPTDCNDADGDTFPGAAELCDGFDNDCNGALDDNPACAACENPGVSEPPVLLEAGSVDLPVLAWNGNGFGAAVYDYDQGRVLFFLLDASGQSLDPPLVLSEDVHSMSLAWTGSEYALIWSRFGLADLRLARIGSDGSLLSGPATVDCGGSSCYDPEIAWTGGRYAVAWTGGSIRLRFLASAGSLQGDAVQVSDGAHVVRHPDLSWNGAGLGVVWEESQPEANFTYGLRFRAFDAEGVPAAPQTSIASLPGNSDRPRLTWAGDRYGLIWEQSNPAPGVVFAVIDAGGAKIGSERYLASAPVRYPGYSWQTDLTWTGTDFGAVWSFSPPTRPGSRSCVSTAQARPWPGRRSFPRRSRPTRSRPSPGPGIASPSPGLACGPAAETDFPGSGISHSP